METNVYFDNVVLLLDVDNYAFETVCEKGIQMTERWTLPGANETGDFSFELIVSDEFNAVVARARTILRITPIDRSVRDPVTLLFVGASLTEYSIYPQHILDLAAADPRLELTLIRSRGGRDGVTARVLHHEGYSGWTAEAFSLWLGRFRAKEY